jgi:membrane-bound lytic murein transglycosylase A
LRRERPRFGPIVQATIATAMTSATSTSRNIQPIALRFLALAAAFVAGCVTVPPPPAAPIPPPAVAPPPPAVAPPSIPSLPARYEPVAWNALPGWNEDRVEEAWPALTAGCAALLASAATVPTWQTPCAAAMAIDPIDSKSARAYFELHFTPYRVLAADGKDTGLVTGYYEPLLAGSRERSSRYSVPLYAAPDDLLTIDLVSLHPDLKDRRLRGRVEGKKVVPYWPRTDIENGKAPVAGKELVFVEDPVEAFFLQIQGSGRVRLTDGSVIRIGYADQNGHPFRSIGRVLAERGELPLERTSMQNIRDWGRRNPEKLPALLDENPSYVFFREIPAPEPGTLAARIDGPIGTLGVPLLAERTLAVDTRSIPLGAPVFLATTYPASTRPLQRLLLAQDTGGAIRGAVRADFFWGFGDGAGREAGRMRQDGRMWLLWPKDAALPAHAGR